MDEILSNPVAELRPDSVAELSRLLTQHGIDMTRWTHPGANSVDDLFRELTRGEARLLDEPLRRELTIVRLLVRRGASVLIETEVIETPGRRQIRNRLASEKLLPGECPVAAARRGVREELGCNDEAIEVIRCEAPTLVTRASAPSYPGLRSDYIIHDVECTVAGLPEGSFETHEEDAHAGKAITHRWEWREADSLDLANA